MTKVRKPLTFQRSLSLIADELGWDGCAAVVGKSESLLRKLSDPDTEREISLQDALRLDNAYYRAGGEGAPLFECYTLRLEAPGMVEAATDTSVLVAAGNVAKEAGEAVAATLHLIGHMDDPKAQELAVIETEQAISVMTKLLRKLTRGGGGK
ncbi:hypothetical protein C1T17_16330 [Sphingobium sp. SCG-1]|uniref:hypothetical protein n=1 Tax=Sphingobium sp. SCG-1 TaxID=2072936 RepID=UPI000CD6BD18|nr:hypothetical protein [Sphingobium sp. SCG-1]AUW59420.1 hypothetical protein C1T17_16330 [Sphingobium sp. SCG-1]